MKVFLTGATGVMGLSAIRALHESGHSVVALARSADKAAAVDQPGVETCLGDVYDRQSLIEGMTGCDVVANLATSVPVGVAAFLPGAWKANDRLRTEGTRIVVEAARQAGVGRVIQQSLSFVYGDHGDDWIDEHSSIDITCYAEPIVVAESLVSQFARDDGDGVSLRFGLITGHDSNSAWRLKRTRAGKPTGIGPEAGWCHVVHPDDVGTAVVSALAAPSGIYNVGAEPLRRKDFVDVYAQAAGRKEGSFRGGLFHRLAGDKIELITRSQRVSSQRLGDLTGWHPRFPKMTPDWFDSLDQ